MNILILEDEIPAYEKLSEHLEIYFSEPYTFDWCRTIVEAKELLTHENKYDILFSDIELLDGISIELFKEIKIDCPIIFCTAYHKYLLDAFKSNGIAYILKPYAQEDISKALYKYNTLFNKTSDYQINDTILKYITSALSQDTHYKSRFIIKTPKGMHLLSTHDISYIEASGTFCKLVDDKGVSHLLSQSITSLNETLDPKQFFRINRSRIINISHIVRMDNYFKNRLLLQMRGSKEKMTTSSSVTAKFRIWLDS